MGRCAIDEVGEDNVGVTGYRAYLNFGASLAIDRLESASSWFLVPVPFDVLDTIATRIGDVR